MNKFSLENDFLTLPAIIIKTSWFQFNNGLSIYIVLKRKQVFLLFLGHLGVPIKQLLSPQLNLSESGGWLEWVK